MWKFLLGPVLLGAICLIGNIYGANAEQVVHKPPSVVRAAISQAIANRREGTVALEGGQPLAFELQLDRISDEQMVVTLMMNGKQGAETHLSFAPQEGGNETLITANREAILWRSMGFQEKWKCGVGERSRRCADCRESQMCSTWIALIH